MDGWDGAVCGSTTCTQACEVERSDVDPSKAERLASAVLARPRVVDDVLDYARDASGIGKNIGHHLRKASRPCH